MGLDALGLEIRMSDVVLKKVSAAIQMTVVEENLVETVS